MKISELCKEKNSGLRDLIDEQIKKNQDDRKKAIAAMVACQINDKVDALRSVRRTEKTIKKSIEKLNKGIEKFGETGDIDELLKVGFQLQHFVL